MISSSLNDTTISDEEFSKMVQLYDSTMSKLERNNNNNDNVIPTRTASTNSGKYCGDACKHNSTATSIAIGDIEKTRIQH
jgi:hypothetical protein